MLPLRSIKMAKGKEGTIVESKTQTRITSSGTQMYWQYKVFWENILLHHGCSSISYEIETTKREIESKEISLTSSSESNSWVDISLSPQNFSFPAITLEDIDGNSLPGRMLEMQVNKKNYGLCTMSSIFEWKNIKLKDAKLSEKNFSFDFFGIGGLTLDKYPQVTPSKKASSEHFLAFRCALKPFAKLAGQQSGDDIKFKSSVVIIDYNVEGAPIPRVSLPNLIFTQKAYCWIMYPPQTSEWISINVKQERGYYYFSQVFPPRGNVYNLAIQTARSKKVYINLPIGTPDKDFVNYLKPSEEYGVPWEKVSE